MLALERISSTAFPNGLCATIGNFDGVHLGHRRLIESARQSADEQGLDFAVITFWPHPRDVLGAPGSHLPLASREMRRELLTQLDVHVLIELPFTADFAALSGSQFVEDFLLPANLRHLFVGHDFSFGHKREGTPEVLARLGKVHGFGISRLAPVRVDGQTVSSSHLRRLIAEGDVAEAARLLGHFYVLEGIVEAGEGRGHKLGFPTANLGQIKTLLPGTGVYATRARIGGKSYNSITNIGSNPTFNGQRVTVETFLLDASGDFYGREMKLEFIKRLRGERKFSDSAELAAQIEKDRAQAQNIFANL